MASCCTVLCSVSVEPLWVQSWVPSQAISCWGGRNCSGDQSCGLAAAYGGLSGWVSGYSVGTAIAVSRVDPHDRFIISFLGSLVGTGVGGIAVSDSDEWTYTLLGPWPFYVGSTIGATLFSEYSRNQHEAPRLSFGWRRTQRKAYRPSPNCILTDSPREIKTVRVTG